MSTKSKLINNNQKLNSTNNNLLAIKNAMKGVLLAYEKASE